MIDKVAKLLNDKSNFLVTTHISPDGDALGSASALILALKKLNKNVTVYLNDEVPNEYSFLKGFETVSHDLPPDHFDVVVAVDCADRLRIGEAFMRYNNYDTLINIDHHMGNDNFGDINLVDGKISSAGLLIYRVLKAAEIEIDYDMAVAIYTTILVDTGSFHYSNTSSESFRVAAELIEKGVNAWDVAEKIYENQPINRINLLKLALSQIEADVEKGYASLVITKKMLNEAEADLSLTDGFINYPRSIRGIEIALMFKELNGKKFKLSLRSKGKADVSAIAERFGGGGHKNAAGCILDGDLDEIKGKVFDCVEEYLKGLK